MKASTIEFRLRMPIQVAIAIVGYWSPWLQAWDFGKRVSLLEWLALGLSRTGLESFRFAAPTVIVAGSCVAAAGMWLRVWGAAYLGYGIVHGGRMQAGGLLESGPYRYVRNPLYLGGWLTMAAVSLIMPPTGALFTVVLAGIFYLRLILAEEAYLAEHHGEAYREYLRGTPRIALRLRATLPARAAKAHWLSAAFTEVNAIGVFVTIAFLSWSFNNDLMAKAIAVTFLISLLEGGILYAPIATAIFAACCGATWQLLHIRPVKAVLISLGIALIAQALLPNWKAPWNKAAHPADLS